jgi:hypothetical protein
MYLALPPEHPLAGKRNLRLEDLHREAWIQTSSASPCARHVVRCCHAAGFEPVVTFESDDYQTVQGLVAAGVGVALIPELALPVVREQVVIRALTPHPPVRRVLAAVPAGARLVPGAPAMLGLLEETAREYDQRRGRPDEEVRAPSACSHPRAGFALRSGPSDAGRRSLGYVTYARARADRPRVPTPARGAARVARRAGLDVPGAELLAAHSLPHSPPRVGLHSLHARRLCRARERAQHNQLVRNVSSGVYATARRARAATSGAGAMLAGP